MVRELRLEMKVDLEMRDRMRLAEMEEQRRRGVFVPLVEDWSEEERWLGE